jgi:hypothetical protein
MVPRTGGYVYDVGVWDLSIIQGPFSVAPCQTLTLRFATFSSTQATSDLKQTTEAADTLQQILSVDSLEKMDTMVDDLAATGRLTPALMLTAAKAYNR